MAKPRPTISKRVREKAKAEKRQDKAERKAWRDSQKEQERADRDRMHPAIDPDIADITPGPQKPVWWDGSC
jgi:hypothetical protein